MVLVVLSGVSGSGTIGAVVLSDPVVLAVLSNAIYIIIYIYIIYSGASGAKCS